MLLLRNMKIIKVPMIGRNFLWGLHISIQYYVKEQDMGAIGWHGLSQFSDSDFNLAKNLLYKLLGRVSNSSI